MEELELKCGKCRRIKSASEFNRNRTRPSGYEGYCIPCKHLSGKNIRGNIAEGHVSEEVQRLVNATSRKPVPFLLLCDKLDMAPKKLKALLAECEKRAIAIQVVQDYVGLKAPSEAAVQQTGIAPSGKRQRIAFISDTHLGSKYCLRDQLKDFIEHAYSTGVRQVLHCGDILDGCYDHAEFEMSHMGIDEQTRDLFETLPQLKGLTYHGIGGNHDETFSKDVGVDVPKFIKNYFVEHGRKDWFAYGNRGAFLRVRGALIHLWHPMGSVGYAISYPLQGKVEGFAPGHKPQILAAGHWHKRGYVEIRGVHAMALPCFQGGGSSFGKAQKTGAPSMGGTIVEFALTKDGTMRDFVYEARPYYEGERPVDISEVAR